MGTETFNSVCGYVWIPKEVKPHSRGTLMGLRDWGTETF